MSLWRDDVVPSRSVLAVLGALAVVAALSLTRTFTSASYLAWALPAMAVGATFALTYGRRSLGLSFLVLSVIEVLTLPALFARDETFYGLPTRAAWRTVSRLLGDGLAGVARDVAPVLPEQKYMVVIWTASIALGFLAGAWVVVARPVGAVVTITSVIAFAGAVGEGSAQLPFTLAALVLTVTFFLVDARQRMTAWSRGRTRSAPSVGVPTLVAACAIGLVAPGLVGTSTPLIGLEDAFSPGLVVIKPLSDVQRQLQVNPPIEVLRVTASQPAYWRLTGLDSYTGREWVLRAEPVAVTGTVVPPPDPVTTGEVVTQRYRIISLLSPWLPAAFAASQIDSPLPVRIDEKSSTLLLSGDTQPGLEYSVISTLSRVQPAAPTTDRLWQPDDRERMFGELAQGIVDGAEGAFERAVRLEEHFRGFTYDEAVDGTHTVDRLQRFLTERRGYCEQFAATMTLMLRGLGIPARVAVGFLPGSERSGQLIVTTREAHAWVEAHIAGMGWVPFDPTPGRGLPREAATADTVPIPTPPPVAELPDEEEIPPPAPQEDETPLAQPPLPEPARDLPLAPFVGAGIGAIVLSVIPVAKASRRRARRSGSAVAAAIGAYAELVDRASDLGLREHAWETPSEFSRRLFADASPQGSAAVRSVVDVAVGTFYAPASPEPSDVRQAWQDLSVALLHLRGRVPWWRRVTAVWDPRTLVPDMGRSARSLAAAHT